MIIIAFILPSEYEFSCNGCLTYFVSVVHLRPWFKGTRLISDRSGIQIPCDPIAVSAMMSTLNLDCHLGNDTARERTAHSPSYTEARNMKSLTFYNRGCHWVNLTK